MRFLTISLLGLFATVAFGFQSQSNSNPASPAQTAPPPGSPAGTPGVKPGSPAGTPGLKPSPRPPAVNYDRMKSPSPTGGFVGHLGTGVSAPPDTYESVKNEADRRFQSWHTVQSNFESEFALTMGEARAASSDSENGKIRFCSGGYTQKLAQLRTLLEAWSTSQVEYWNFYRRDVRLALDATNDVLAHQLDAGSRLNREVEQARTELDSLKSQREELRTSLAAASGTDEQNGPAKAVIAELDRLIALAEGQTKVVANANETLEDRRELVSRAKQQEALIGKIDEALNLVDLDRRYWLSIYSWRSAQISEMCTPPSTLPSAIK